MRGKIVILLFSVISIFSLGHVTPAGAIDSSRDCDKYAIVHCGTMSTSEIKDKYNNGDNNRVFSAFGIEKSDIEGDIRSGVVYQDGRVVVDGKTVATDAIMAARHLGGSAISGSETAKKVSVSKMSEAQTAFVKFDANGRFEWAIMKPCGNPVTATPTKPKPEPAAICKALNTTSLSRTEYRLDATATTENGATIQSYSFTVKNSAGTTTATETITTTGLTTSYTLKNLQPGTYTAKVVVKTSVGDKTSANCEKIFTVAPPEKKPIKVCELTSKNIITIDEKDFDNSRHSRNLDDCKEITPVKVEVCEVATKKIIVINEADFDSNKHSKNLNDCKETATPVELPETGIIDTASKLFGLTSLAGSSAYYVFSRRF